MKSKILHLDADENHEEVVPETHIATQNNSEHNRRQRY